MTVQKAIAIDTNLLVLLIVGLTDRKYIDRHRRLAPVYRAEHFDVVMPIVSKAPKVVCTAHILTEASNLLRQIAEPMRSQIMRTFKRFIDGADEEPIESKRATAAPGFLRLGLTDAAILSLDPAKVQLLTVDHDLHVASSRLGFDVVNLTPTFTAKCLNLPLVSAKGARNANDEFRLVLRRPADRPAGRPASGQAAGADDIGGTACDAGSARRRSARRRVVSVGQRRRAGSRLDLSRRRPLRRSAGVQGEHRGQGQVRRSAVLRRDRQRQRRRRSATRR